jgi:hypothetical protein
VGFFVGVVVGFGALLVGRFGIPNLGHGRRLCWY